eukprot:RCo007096
MSSLPFESWAVEFRWQQQSLDQGAACAGISAAPLLRSFAADLPFCPFVLASRADMSETKEQLPQKKCTLGQPCTRASKRLLLEYTDPFRAAFSSTLAVISIFMSLGAGREDWP